jgi:hypothetical protein
MKNNHKFYEERQRFLFRERIKKLIGDNYEDNERVYSKIR